MRVKAYKASWGTVFILPSPEEIMSETLVVPGRFSVEVQTRGESKFYGNALTFPDLGAAETYAKDLYSRWTAVDVWRVVRFVPAGWGIARLEVKRMGE